MGGVQQLSMIFCSFCLKMLSGLRAVILSVFCGVSIVCCIKTGEVTAKDSASFWNGEHDEVTRH